MVLIVSLFTKQNQSYNIIYIICFLAFGRMFMLKLLGCIRLHQKTSPIEVSCWNCGSATSQPCRSMPGWSLGGAWRCQDVGRDPSM